MSKLAFTPGPWGTHPFAERAIYVGPIHEGIYQGDIAALEWNPSRPKEVQQANAKLISAAPDLYDSLKRLLLCPDLDIDLDRMDPETIEAKEQARNALAKAVQP